MAREPRNISATGIYHVMLRGADRRIIFSDDQDCAYFLKALSRAKDKSDFLLYSYCLMGNHVHLLLREKDEPVELIFKRLGVSYVHYYNKKYELHGHLFQDRFRSEAVETEAYFLDCLRYICQNPVKAGLSRTPSEYAWLGCSGIFGKKQILDEIGPLSALSRKQLLAFVSVPCNADHLDDSGPKRLTDSEAIQRIRKVCGCKNVHDLGGWEKRRRNNAIVNARRAGISIRQLSRLTAISKNAIVKAGLE